MMMEHISGFIGSKVISPIIECVDVDGVVRKVEIDDVVKRIDIDALLDRVDMDRLLDRVDLNRHLRRVDVNSLIGRSDMAALFAQSTTGVFSQIFDITRTQLIILDLFQFQVTQVPWRGYNNILPPRPGLNPSRDNAAYPRRRVDKAIAVQGRFTGFISKAFAILIDIMFLTLAFEFVMIVVQLSWIFFIGDSGEDAKQKVSDDRMWVVIAYCVLWWLYFFLSVLLIGRTVGMAIAGLRVININGRPGADECDDDESQDLSFCQALVRTSLLPLSTAVFLPLAFFWINPSARRTNVARFCCWYRYGVFVGC
jgi:hypothetical protein